MGSDGSDKGGFPGAAAEQENRGVDKEVTQYLETLLSRGNKSPHSKRYTLQGYMNKNKTSP